jgi:MFS family permease
MASIRALQELAVFDSLHNRNYRWYWLSRLSSSATMRMGGVAQGWLVYQLTGSALALGLVTAGWSITSSALAPFGGVISDRLEKRQLLFWTRGLMAASAIAIAAVIALGVVQIWHLVIYSLFRGVLFAVSMPAQQAYLAELVDRKTLLNAVSLNSVGMSLAGISSALLAGLVIDWVGVAAVYLGIALLYLLVILVLTQLPNTGHSDPGQSSVLADLREGIRYLGVVPVLLPILGLVFARGLLAMPYRTFMPKYAEDVLALDARGLGLLVGMPSWGSLASSLALASLGSFREKGKLSLIAGVVLGLAIVAFANSQTLIVAAGLLVIVGASSQACIVTTQTLMQTNSAAEYRGRVMSMYMMMFGLTRLGNIPAGAAADSLGLSVVLALGGGLFALVCALIAVLIPSVRKLE